MTSETTAAGATAAPTATPALSEKALGKQRVVDQPIKASPTPATTKPTRAQAVQKRERRVTRSSRGGTDDAGTQGNAADSEGESLNYDETLPGVLPPAYLPARTRIVLTTKPPRNLVPFRPQRTDPLGETSQPPAIRPPPYPEATTSLQTANLGEARPPKSIAGPHNPLAKPPFRQLNEIELLPPRGTRHAAAEIDTSEAFYLRLHRYPEVLEKRASRLERERLIHERSKLMNEIEELRARTWVYAGTSAGGRAEEERQRKIKALSERLARYDALLPNQPRKSNFLNLAGAGAVPPASNTAQNGGGDGRTASPSLQAPSSSSRRKATTNGTSSRQGDPLARPSTPVSASVSDSSGNKTTIRIKFGPPAVNASKVPSTDPDLDLERYTSKGELRKGPKRDRRAERARAEERRRLGLKPRSSIDKATARIDQNGEVVVAGRLPPMLPRKDGIKRERRPSRSGVLYAETDDENALSDDGDEEEDELDEDEEMADPEKPPLLAQPAKLVRKRLPDSFFHSAALRDAVMASHGPNARRASSRVAYAFGQRLPDQALLQNVDFELRGGVAGTAEDDEPGHTRTTLEDLLQARMEQLGEEAVVLGGRVLPKSAVDAWSKDPLHVSPVVHRQRTLSATSDAPSSAAGSQFAAPLPPLLDGTTSANTPSTPRQVSPELTATPLFCSPLRRMSRPVTPELGTET